MNYLEMILNDLISQEKRGQFIFPKKEESFCDGYTWRETEDKLRRDHYFIIEVSSQEGSNVKFQGRNYFAWKKVVM